MKIEKVIDYALPCMRAEYALKEVHLKMLDKQYDDALNECAMAIVAITDMMSAIKEMKANNK